MTILLPWILPGVGGLATGCIVALTVLSLVFALVFVLTFIEAASPRSAFLFLFTPISGLAWVVTSGAAAGAAAFDVAFGLAMTLLQRPGFDVLALWAIAHRFKPRLRHLSLLYLALPSLSHCVFA